MNLMLSLLAAFSASDYSFVSIGDWGGHALKEATYSQNTAKVAKQLKASAQSLGAHFVVGTGDNFYFCGIQNTSDFQVKSDFSSVYLGGTGALSRIPWYQTLGNHEYGYNVSAQLDLHALIPTWNLPSRYYTKRVTMSAGHSTTFIFLDSSPCISEYRANNQSGWDPCGGDHPTCTISGGSGTFEGPCHFHKNIIAQDCTTQFTWFKQQLAAVPDDDWLIVVAHHPADEIDVEDFLGALEAHGKWHLWLNGHAHTLTHYEVDGKPAFVTTGAGSMVATEDQKSGTPGKDRTYFKVNDIPLPPYKGHQYKQLWNQKVAGFTTHTFNADFSSLTTNFVTYTGEVVQSFVVDKSGSGPSPSPSPSPPSPTRRCCYYRSSKCYKGQVCCKSSCYKPASCSYSKYSCSKYGWKHYCKWNGAQCVVN